MSNINRRAILAGAASAAVTVPAVAGPALEPDPIYAEIAAHEKAWDELGANCSSSFHYQPEAQHPNSSALHKPPADYPIFWQILLPTKGKPRRSGARTILEGIKMKMCASHSAAPVTAQIRLF